MKKIKQWFVKTYDLGRDDVNTYDWLFMGTALGVVIVALKSPFIAIIVFLLLAHLSWKRK